MIYVSDVDECTEGMDKCDHNCHNTNGSYTCSCNGGYTLHSNGFTCIGKYVLPSFYNGHMYLIIASNHLATAHVHYINPFPGEADIKNRSEILKINNQHRAKKKSAHTQKTASPRGSPYLIIGSR